MRGPNKFFIDVDYFPFMSKEPVMREIPNPLFQEYKPKTKMVATAAATGIEVDASAPPLSPITGKPMELIFCGDTPTYVDMQSRIVYPIRD